MSRGASAGDLHTSGESEGGAPDTRSPVEQILTQQAAVAAFGQHALVETELDHLLDDAASLVARTLDVDLVSVMELAPDASSLQLVAGCGWRDGLVRELRLDTESGSLSGYTLVTGGPVIVEDLRHEERFSVADVLSEHGAVSAMSVRIGAEAPFGALAVFTNRPGEFTRDDANFLQAIANVLAGAVARLRAETELRHSRDELAAIVGNVTDGIIVQRHDGELGFANDAAARLTGFSSAAELMATPLAEVIERYQLLHPDGRPMGVEELPGRRAMSGENPPEMLVRFRIAESGEDRWSLVQAAPVRHDDGTVLQVINVFRDITAQKRSDEVRQFVTDALASMTSTLDSTEAARRLAEACVPSLADYCFIDLLEADGSLTSAAVVHTEQKLAGVAQQQRDRLMPHVSDDDVPGSVVREAVTRQGDTDPFASVAGHLPASPDRYLSVPLLSRGRPIGALTLIAAGGGRTFAEDEVGLVEELGARAGPAIENARLYEAVDDRRAELDAVLTAMAEAVLVFDPRGGLRLSNPAASRLFGGAVPQSTAELAERLQLVEDTGRRLVLDDISESGTDAQLPATGRWLEVRRYRAARTGADRGQAHAPSVVVLRDVTDVRAARAARDAFMGLLSHELRTPITTIYGGSQLLERGMNDERRTEVVSDIKAESERLARLIEDLLVMTRVERGGVEIGDEPVLVQRLLPPLAESMIARWPGLRIDLLLGEGLPAVRGDVTYLEQIVRNLLTNALRYGKALESGLTVRAYQQGDEVVVAVLDRGPGIAGEEPERLFELFYRAASALGVPGGAGIGLFVCRQLVEAMGGRIWAEPRHGGGTEFAFALPVLEADIG
jgi:PAS domain S-box-containing protein